MGGPLILILSKLETSTYELNPLEVGEEVGDYGLDLPTVNAICIPTDQ